MLCSPVPGAPVSPPLDAGADGGTCPANPFASLDVTDDAQIRAALCTTETVASTARTLQLGGLAPGVPYSFAVVAEDLAGNRSTVAFASDCVRPRAVTDFWEQYRSQGGQAAPGACAVATPGRGSLGAGGFALAGLVAVGALVRRRRRASSRPAP